MRFRNVLFLIVATLLFVGAAEAQNAAPPIPTNPSVICNSCQISLNASSVSSNIQLQNPIAAYNTTTIYNSGTVDAYVAQGTSSGVTASTSNILVKAGQTIQLWASGSYIAGISPSGTTSLVIYQSNGPIAVRADTGTLTSSYLAQLVAGMFSPPLGVIQNASNPITTTMQNAAVANGNGFTLNTTGMSSAALTLGCSVACSGGTAIFFEETQDGTNYDKLYCQNGASSSVNTVVLSGTAASIYVCPSVANQAAVRARIANYSAGTVNVTGTTSPMPGGGSSIVTSLTNDASGNPIGSSGGGLNVNVVGGVATGYAQGSTTSGQLGPLNQAATTTSAPTYTTGTTNPLSSSTVGSLRTCLADLTGNCVDPTTPVQVNLFDAVGNAINSVANALNVNIASGNVGITGTLPAFAATPTVNLGTIGTAATAANQTTANTSLATIATNSGTQATAANQTATQAPIAPATATATKSTMIGTQYNVTAPTASDGQQGGLQTDAHLDLKTCLTDTTGTCTDPTQPVAVFRDDTYQRMNSNTTTTFKSGAGSFEKICWGVKGASANVVDFYDNTAASGTVIWHVDTTTVTPGYCADIGAHFSTGLTAQMQTGTAADFTVVSR